MVSHDDEDDNDVPDMDMKKMLKLILQEITDVRRELKEEIVSLDRKLSGKIDGLASDIKGLRLEVHQNQITLMKNHDDLEQRVTVLEAAAA